MVSLDVILGDNIRYNFDYYLDNGFYWSLGFNSKLTTFNKNISAGIARDLNINSSINTLNIDF